MIPKRSQRRLIGESLEPRCLLAASLDSGTGILSLVGTARHDHIEVSLSDDQTRIVVAVNLQRYAFDAGRVAALRIEGRVGNDRITVAEAVLIDAVIRGGAGDDRLTGGGGNDLLLGGGGNDRLWGGAGEDVLHGDGGHDQLFGGEGLDKLWGAAGNDVLDGGQFDDELFGGAGADRLRGGAGNDKLFGGQSGDRLDGQTGDDLLFGESGNDSLRGGADNDRLKGGAGNDRLLGGMGEDLLDGDGGADRYADGFVVDLNAELHATLVGPNGASGVARYRHVVEGGVVEMKLEIHFTQLPQGNAVEEGGAATKGGGRSHLHRRDHDHQPDKEQKTGVYLDNVLIASLSDEQLSSGQVRLSNLADQPGELPLPAGVVPQAGNSLTIGTLLFGSFVSAFA